MSSETILVYPTAWACDIPHDWDPMPPMDCHAASWHFHANCERCMYNPNTCADCRKGKCERCHTSERVSGPTPEEVRERMRAHWATEHEPADLLEMLDSMRL
jgi:hypothetical protein